MFTMPIVVSAQDSIDEVRQLADHPTLERAFEIIEELEPRTISDLIKLTQVAAPPFMEEKRAAVYAEWLAEAGADSVFIDDEGNVVAIGAYPRSKRIDSAASASNRGEVFRKYP